MEKWLFKKIEMWVLLLLVVLGFAFLIPFGATVRHVADGGKSTGLLGDAAFAMASIPSDLKALAKGPEDFVTHEAPTTAFSLSEYDPVAVDADNSVSSIPVYWASDSHGPFQPMALMFRLDDDQSEHLMIIGPDRQVKRHFPVTAGSLSGKYPPLIGNSSPQLLDDASYVIHSHGSDGLYRKDLCGNVLWSRPGLFHHTFSIADGKLAILGLPEEAITDEDQKLWNSSDIFNVIDLETGAVEQSVSLVEIAYSNIHAIDPFGLDDWESAINDNNVLIGDPIHLNKMEILSEELAAEYPDFPAGAWLVSSRRRNLLFVVDPSTLEILWFSQGHTQRQHDPDFVGDNRIIAFNNGSWHNAEEPANPANFSSIRAYDFGSEQWSEPYNASAVAGYTDHSGEVAAGDNDVLMLTLSVQGRYLEVSESGEVISEFVNIRDNNSQYWTKSAQYLSAEQYDIARNITC